MNNYSEAVGNDTDKLLEDLENKMEQRITNLEGKIKHMEPRMQNQQESVQKALADSETRMQNTQSNELTEKDSWKTSNFGKILRDHSYRIGNFMQIIWTVSVDNCIHTFDDYIW